ncbi:E3 ubiquitin-protein ligase BOI-like [Mercurialis annua]|uniref:E3 ubiquitin-protein ligase BOI-like n=1 Tax=Mercurialis annua TaxID=3986 RepID=UPI00215FDC83|nr:E3 ubiquitin-protein ligase BOI-like [Mercurialis annua]
MFGGNNSNSVFPISFEETHLHGEVNAFPQLQLFGENGVGCIRGPMNHIGNEHATIMQRPAKRVRDSQIIPSAQKRHSSSNNNSNQYEAGQLGIIVNPNPVSIGLKLSCEEEEYNSPVTHPSGSKINVQPIMAILDNLKVETDRQEDELHLQMKLQEDSMRKSMRELGERHTASFLLAVETGIGRKLLEKEVEIQNINRKNNELVERINQISAQVQSWQYRAKYNESVVNALKSNLKHVMAQSAIHGKEGCGDSGVDTAASYANQNDFNVPEVKMQIICRACKTKEALILLLPCRHLCLCKDCAGFVDACPICQVTKTAGVEVYTS